MLAAIREALLAMATGAAAGSAATHLLRNDVWAAAASHDSALRDHSVALRALRGLDAAAPAAPHALNAIDFATRLRAELAISRNARVHALYDTIRPWV